jgi:galactose mutarotase-like enzyme
MALPSIQKSMVGRTNALVLENEKIRTVILPEMGARVLSLIYKPTETEFAWRSPNVPIEKTNEALENVSGFFDCIPTTDPCTFRGNKLPLGGEVSSKPWKILKIEKRRAAVTLRMEARCKIYPLLIRKKITLRKNKSALEIEYEVCNLSTDTLEYHYSGHNTIQVSPYHRLVIPHEVTKLKLGYDSRFGKMGDMISWPEAVDTKGNRVDISKIAGPCEGIMENFYTAKLKERWCAAINEAKQEAIAVTWQGEALPYLNICTNTGAWRDYYFAALEPVTGRPDNLEVAVNQWKDYATLKPKEKTTWKQTFILSHNIKQIEKIENDTIIPKK